MSIMTGFDLFEVTNWPRISVSGVLVIGDQLVFVPFVENVHLCVCLGKTA